MFLVSGLERFRESLSIREILNDKSFKDLQEDRKALLRLLFAMSLVKI
jgi:hypothetical protein